MQAVRQVGGARSLWAEKLGAWGSATSSLLSQAMRGQWRSLAGNPEATQGPRQATDLDQENCQGLKACSVAHRRKPKPG